MALSLAFSNDAAKKRYFVHASDLADMWLRDTCALLHPYVLSIWSDNQAAPVAIIPGARRVVEGAALTMAELFSVNPNCSIWSESLVEALLHKKTPVCPARLWPSSGVIGFELDEPLYLLRLIWHLHKAFPTSRILYSNGPMHKFAAHLLRLIQQKKEICGLISTKDRPSDDPTVYPMHIPDNFFAAASLAHLHELASTIWQDEYLATRALELQQAILNGTNVYGVQHHPKFGRVYCYEVTCDGKCLYRDDANLPSLVSIPYLDEGKKLFDKNIYLRTRRMVLSKEGNGLFFTGKYASGVGSESARTGTKIW
eukprot:CAMPEP_0197298712 /NCGR_PEP_ID=MMETSP0890-20130614/44166_1 /TAXON_ID=44058 ORGANISM="Aureoumbra lagunensis, Strain CCMP1510" /NCGR_SAMPLE_ID=MMETSP0890 /ASSEMBLY_ACC=CAM_ASM_000533 /LENGTH=311 /DNA_ID=CAMNT_0042776617 /DNA_START=224 /DNA_END=1157 /DNA_ORIENTATION=+